MSTSDPSRNSVFFNTTRMNAPVNGTGSISDFTWNDILSGSEEEVEQATQLFDSNDDNKVQSDELTTALDFNGDGVVDNADYDAYMQASSNEDDPNHKKAGLLKNASRQTFSDISSFLTRLKQQENGQQNQ